MTDTAAGGSYSAIDIDQLDKLIGCFDDAGTTLSNCGGRFRPEATYFGLSREVDEIADIAAWARDQLPGLRRRLDLAQQIESQREVSLPTVSLPEPLPPDELMSKPVVLRSHAVSGDLTGTFMIKLESGATVTIEELSDGRYQVKLRNEAGVGYGLGLPSYNAGVVVDGKTYGVGYSVSAQGMLSFGTGDVYYADSLDEAQELVGLLMLPPPARQAGGLATDLINNVSPFPDLPTIPEANEWFVEAGAEIGGEVKAMQFMGAVGANATLRGYLGATLRQDGTATAYLEGSLKGTASAHHVLFGEAGASFEGEVLAEVDLDDNGEPVALRLRRGHVQQAHAGGPDGTPAYHETTYEIPLDWENDDELVRRALEELAGTGTGPHQPAAGSGGSAVLELANEMADRSYRYRDTYSHETREDGAFANAQVYIEGVPVAVGVDGDVESVSRNHTGREYWNGEAWVPVPGY